MITLNEIKKVLLEENINNYEIFSTGRIIEDGLYIGNLNALLEFVKEQRIAFVLCCEHYIEGDEYIITEDTIKNLPYGIPNEFVQEIFNYIEEYNDKILSLDFSLPKHIIVACLYDGHYFYTCIENAFSIDGYEILTPKEALHSIIQKHQDRLDMVQKKRSERIEKLKEDLANIILSDSNFKKQTNKHLRKNYIIDLFSNKLNRRFEPLKELWYREEFHSVWQDAIDFIELLWREVKE